jgi:Uma2 family endonuclease
MGVITAIQEKKAMTAEEYLRLERITLREKGGKYEFFNQKRRLMAGGAHPHNQAIANTSSSLLVQLRQAKIKSSVTSSETKVMSFLSYKNYLYPDLVIIEGRPYYEDDHKDIVLNPKLIIEVLSNATEGFDRGDKFKSYRQITSLTEYILIDSKKQSIEQFYKDEAGEWHFGHEITEGTMRLRSFPIDLAIDDVYFDVEFETSAV